MSLNKYLLFPFILGVTFIFWKCTDAFFWRDDWFHLLDYTDGNFSFFQGDSYNDVKPLFKYYFLALTSLFGINALFYHYANLIIWALIAFFFVKTLKSFDLHLTDMIWIAPVVFIIHPVNFINILWIFQSCEMIHLLLQTIAVNHFITHVYKKDQVNLKAILLVAILCLISNLFFPNSTFFPLVFLGAVLIKPGSIGSKKMSITVFGMLSIILPLLMLYMTSINKTNTVLEEETTVALSTKLMNIAIYFFQLLGVGLVRILFISEKVFGSMAFVVGLVMFTLLTALTYRHSKAYRGYIQILLLWLLTNSISVPLARANAPDPPFHFYYSSLIFIPAGLLLTICIYFLIQHYFYRHIGTLVKMTKPVLPIAFIGLFLLDQHLIDIFQSRNIKNKAAMEAAIETNTPYKPFDDPVFGMDVFTKIGDGRDGKTLAVEVYKELKGETRIVFP